jgi:hypothetical protein
MHTVLGDENFCVAGGLTRKPSACRLSSLVSAARRVLVSKGYS